MTEVSISYLFKLLIRRLYIILFAGVICAAATFTYCNWFANPVYSASGQLIISNGAVIAGEFTSKDSKTDEIQRIASTDIQASMYLSDVCNSLLKSPEMYKKLESYLNNEVSKETLSTSFSISLEDVDSLFINVSYKSHDKNEAIKNVNAFLTLAPDFLKEYLPEARALPTAYAEKAKLISPQTIRNTVILFLVGAFIAYGIAFAIEMTDRTIKGEADFTEFHNVPVLGSVPNFESTENDKGGYSYANSNK